MAWLSGWNYRKKITISGTSGAGTNYQVLLKVGESSGASGYDFHLNNHSASFPSGKNQGGDLRFTSSNGTTLLDFWVESVSGSSPNRLAYIWVEVADDLSSSKDIYCYYGNSSATNYSNGDNTFILFDDFDGSSLNTNKWTLAKGSVNISNSILNFEYRTAIRSVSLFSRGIRIRQLSNVNYTGSYQYTHTWWGDNYHTTYATPNGNGYISKYSSDYYHLVDITKVVNNTPTTIVQNNNVYLGTTWHLFDFLIDIDDYLKILVDNEEKVSTTDTTFTNQTFYVWRNGYIDMANSPCNWIFVAKYIYPEPSFYSIGSEESSIQNTGNFFLFF
ncbi:MAG: DUF2341 domain-containing protein [Candidatus Aenigmatarchaeota archaeon]